jgi:hypothetical protein
MTKASALSSRMILDGVDITGDVGAVGSIEKSRNQWDITNLSDDGVARMPTIEDGKIDFTGFWDRTTDAIFDQLSAMTVANRMATVCVGGSRGDEAAVLIAKQGSLTFDRSTDSSLAVSCGLVANGYGVEWGQQLTAGSALMASAGNGTAVDLGAVGPPVAITSSSVANPTHIVTATPHGLVSGDSVTIAGHSGSTPTVNGSYTVTYVGPSEYSVPVDVSAGGTGGTSTKTSTGKGALAFWQLVSIVSGNIVVKVQTSPDGSTGWADVTGLLFAQKTARGTERVATTSTTKVQRYARIVASGTFANVVQSVVLTRRP